MPKHNRANGWVFRVLGQHVLEPGHLVCVEHVGRSIIHADEVDAALDPVIVGLHQMIVWIVGQALLPYAPAGQASRRIAAIRLWPGLGRYQLVVPYPRKTGRSPNGFI